MQGEKILVIWYDKKMQSCKNRLIGGGFECRCADGTELIRIIPFYEYIVLPLPTLANGCIAGTGLTLSEFADSVGDMQTVLYGNLKDNHFGDLAKSYYNESFLIKNSRLTAQGTLRLILENCEEDLFGMPIAVTGYGKCGKAICRMLKNNGACVTSFSRKVESRTQAESDGLMTGNINDINKKLYDYRVIINTVPFNIINEKELEKLTDKNLFIEIASKPYGFDIGKADKFNFRYVLAESLPGKYSPVSAGQNIADTVLEIIKEGKHE